MKKNHFPLYMEKGTQSVEVDTIDNIVKERVDFIKLDIEGAEQDAIDGAKRDYKQVQAYSRYLYLS